MKTFVDEIMSIDEFGTFIRYDGKRLHINQEARFYRVIPLINNQGNFKEDFSPFEWKKVSPHKSIQRLNTEKESVLYTSNLDRVSMEEVGISSKFDKFAMFIYRPKIEFDILSIQSNPFTNELFPHEFHEYGKQTTKMLNEVFSTPSSGNYEHDKLVYEISNYIKNKYFPLNRNESYKGWSYLSVKFKEAIDYQPNYSKDELNYLCFAFPDEIYEECFDMDDVSCVLFNCTDEELSKLNLKYSINEIDKNKIIRGELK